MKYALILTIGWKDVLCQVHALFSRVGVWEAAKWVAQVREKTCPTCSQSVILKTNMSGGHFGEGGRYIHCEDVAFEYAFLIKAMGMLDDEKQSHVL